MSKKMSKVLLVLVIALVMVCSFALVACGGDKKKDEGPKALEAATAMETLQTGFAEAETKSVTENISVGGLSVAIGNMKLSLKNVDIAMTRSYDENGVLNIKAEIKNLDVSFAGLKAIMNLIPQFGLPQETVDKLNIDTTVIANLKKVKINADVDITVVAQGTSVKVNDFTIWNLDQVRDKNNKQLGVLTDGKGKPLGNKYSPSEINGTTVDTWHEKDTSVNPKDQDGLFRAMDLYCNNLAGGTAGTNLENYLVDNYQMLTLYRISTVTVADTKLTSNAPTDFSEVYALGDEILSEYGSNVVSGTTTVNDLLNTAFGATKVEDVVSQLVDMGNADMTATVKADGKAWKVATMTTKQTIKVHLSGATLQGVMDMIPGLLPEKDQAKFNKIMGIVKPVVGGIFEEGINTNINVKTDATFNY